MCKHKLCLFCSYQLWSHQAQYQQKLSVNCEHSKVPSAFPFDIGYQVFSFNTAISQADAEELEFNIRGQSSNEQWRNEHLRRITASNFGLVCRKVKTFDKHPDVDSCVPKTFLNTVYKQNSFNSSATRYGLEHENIAFSDYCKLTGSHVHPCGLVVNPTAPFLGASPDGIVCSLGVTGAIEVKCPYAVKAELINDVISSGRQFHLEKLASSSEIVLKRKHNYYFQVQGQLMITGFPFCDFVTYTSKGLHVDHILPDLNFMKEMYTCLYKFHHGYAADYLK